MPLPLILCQLKFYTNYTTETKVRTIGSGNWIVDNLNSALSTWNGKLTEIWSLLSTSPESFRGGGVWSVILNINDALKAIGYALVVLFFVVGVVKTCGSFAELKKPEMAARCFVRFALAQAAVTYGMELLMTLIQVAQGSVTTIMGAAGLTTMTSTTLPTEMVTIIEGVGFLESIPLWTVTLLGSLLIWVLSLVMILTVYSRFFKLYMAIAIAPITLASFAGQPSSSIGISSLPAARLRESFEGKCGNCCQSEIFDADPAGGHAQCRNHPSAGYAGDRPGAPA